MRPSLVLLLALAAFAGCAGPRLTEGELSDPGIKARLEAEFQAHKELDLQYVTIDVHQKIVTVSGVVNTWNERRLIERIAYTLKGPEQVLVNVAIRD